MAKKKVEELNEEQEKVFYSFKKGANIFLCGKEWFWKELPYQVYHRLLQKEQ